MLAGAVDGLLAPGAGPVGGGARVVTSRVEEPYPPLFSDAGVPLLASLDERGDVRLDIRLLGVDELEVLDLCPSYEHAAR